MNRAAALALGCQPETPRGATMRIGPDALECPLSGEHVKILRRPDEHGEHAEYLITLAAVGSGPGPHLHPEQVEQFRVVRGRVQVLAGADTITADIGQDVTVPPGTAHSFRALEAETQLRLRVTPGHGFEAALEDVFELLDQGQLGPDGPVDPAAWNACFEQHKQVMISARSRPGNPGPGPA
ncbi:MAG: cupin domain-containing protein [Actinomycetota bacterium]|nr:cupin domain-containing protein [Actinomycetota bacterium]